jgi:hypothetical protein
LTDEDMLRRLLALNTNDSPFPEYRIGSPSGRLNQQQPPKQPPLGVDPYPS